MGKRPPRGLVSFDTDPQNQIDIPNVCFIAHLFRKPFHTFRDAL